MFDKNRMLVHNLKGFLNVSYDKLYDENLGIVHDYFMQYPAAMLGCMSCEIYDYIITHKDDHHFSFLDMVYEYNYEGYEEDFKFLCIIGVISPINYEFEPGFKEIVLKAMEYPHAKEIIYQAQLIKGMVDMFGLITLSEISELLVTRYGINCNEEEVKNVIINSAMFIRHVVIDENGLVYRKEINDPAKYLENRNKVCGKQGYAWYRKDELINFANKFVHREFSNEKRHIDFLNDPIFQILLDPVSLVCQRQYIKDIGSLALYNLHTPKWLFKGLTIEEFNNAHTDIMPISDIEA